MTDDSNSELEELRIDQQRRGLLHRADGGGASILQDTRVSKVQGWLWSIIGAGLVGAVLLASNNLYQLNVAITRLTDNGAVFSERLKDHELRLRQVEKDLSAVEGKVFRGVDGYDKEPKRGK